MKPKLTDEIKELFTQSVNWAKIEIEYLKLTAAEKIIILISMMVIGIVVLLLLLPAILMFLFALAQVFIGFLPVAVAYVCVGGIVLLLLGILVLFRKQVVINPVAKFISKVLLDHPENKNSKK
ncbi:MAG: phage holin family protein [Muribaculaceae bacterium]|nr:phage holin family protein [Muribaculaceae bacterium]